MLSIKLTERDSFYIFFCFAEMEAQRHCSAAHGQRPLPGQPDPHRPSSHHTVSPPGGQPVLGATGDHLSHGWEGRRGARGGRSVRGGGWGGGGRGRGGADSGPALKKDSEHHICTLSVALQRDGRSEAENCTFVMSTSSSCSLCLGDNSVTKNIFRPC